MDEYQRNPGKAIKQDENLICHAEIFESSDGWFIEIMVGEDTEVGPFPTVAEAIRTANALLKEQGFHVLREAPWTENDAKQYPL